MVVKKDRERVTLKERERRYWREVIAQREKERETRTERQREIEK